MIERVTAQEIAEKWGVSLRYVQALCQKGKIPGAERKGRDWMIPMDAARPMDGRTKAARQGQASERNLPLPRNTPFLYMTDLYSVPVSADQCT